MKRTANLAPALVLVLSASHASAQTSTSQRQSYSSTTTAILVDVVVRDKKGRPVTDLSSTDFELAEDGVVQRIDSFTRVSRGGGIGVGVAWKSRNPTTAVSMEADATEKDGTTPKSAADQVTTALVFDHLSSESLRLAQKATLEYVPFAGESNVRIGVFASNPGVRVLQPYTTDRTKIRKAIALLAPSGTAAQDENEERVENLRARRRELDAEDASGGATASTATGGALADLATQVAQRENERRMVQTELNMLRSFDNLDRDYRGYDTTRALLAVVDTLSYLPGRKTIVFFSQGLPVSPSLSAKLDLVIAAANRANVTAYAIDANGLRTKTSSAGMMKEIQTFNEDRTAQLNSGNDRTEEPLMMAFERVEDTFKLDSRTGLAKLAEQTGGFLVEQSNNLTAAFKRIDEDNRFHYLLTYAPINTEFDGKFRAIQVKVRRPGMQVFARKGYRAIGAPRGIEAGGYESPALELLDRAPLPNAFPVYAAGFSFPDPARPGVTSILVHVNTDVFRFNVDGQRSTYSGQAAVVVRIKDRHGREVQKLSQQYVFSGDAKDLDAARKGEILFYREPDLQPGVYTMETIVFDALARQGSARVATLSVPAADAAKLEMSSLVLVNRVEDVNEAQRTDSTAPLYVGRSLLYPNVGEPIRKSVSGELPFYFALYGTMHAASASAQLLRNGQLLAEAPVQLPPASGSRIQQVGRFPIGALPPGTYELRIRVTGGTGELSRSAFFTLQDR